MPEQDLSTDDLTACASAALERMKELRNRPSPRGYEVWLAYFAGSNGNLKADIDALIDLRRTVTDRDLEDLHTRHLFGSTADNEVHEITSEIEVAVDKVLSVVGSAGDNIRGYGDTLEGAADRLRGPTDAESVREAVRSLLESTRKVAQRSRELEDQLSRSNKHISDLRTQLTSLREVAETDALTGLHNRRFFEMALPDLAAAASGSDKPLSLCMIDIDHFKQFNDSHGHQVGDQVLKLVSRALHEGVRASDVAARYGGEEFAVLLLETHLGDAMVVADELRRLVGKKTLLNRATRKSVGSIDLSIGVSEYRRGEPLAAFVSRADAALYMAKNSGRNKVCSETMLPEGAQTVRPVPSSPEQAPTARAPTG